MMRHGPPFLPAGCSLPGVNPSAFRLALPSWPRDGDPSTTSSPRNGDHRPADTPGPWARPPPGHVFSVGLGRPPWVLTPGFTTVVHLGPRLQSIPRPSLYIRRAMVDGGRAPWQRFRADHVSPMASPPGHEPSASPTNPRLITIAEASTEHHRGADPPGRPPAELHAVRPPSTIINLALPTDGPAFGYAFGPWRCLLPRSLSARPSAACRWDRALLRPPGGGPC